MMYSNSNPYINILNLCVFSFTNSMKQTFIETDCNKNNL